jgi:hypothetical protein
MLIRVTQEHIDHGQRASCVACPIALAVTDMSSPGLRVHVGFSTVTVGLETHELPPSARQFIARFDTPHLRPLAVPFEFELPDYVGAGGVWR